MLLTLIGFPVYGKIWSHFLLEIVINTSQRLYNMRATSKQHVRCSTLALKATIDKASIHCYIAITTRNDHLFMWHLYMKKQYIVPRSNFRGTKIYIWSIVLGFLCTTYHKALLQGVSYYLVRILFVGLLDQTPQHCLPWIPHQEQYLMASRRYLDNGNHYKQIQWVT